MKVSVLYFLLFMVGCHGKLSVIESTFEKLSATLSQKEKVELQNCSDVGCVTMLVEVKVSKKFAEAYRQGSKEISRYLSDSFQIERPFDQQRSIALAYQRKLKGQGIDFRDIAKEISQYDQTQENKYSREAQNEIVSHADMAKRNFQAFRPGDSIDLSLPLGLDGNKRVVYFYTRYDKSNFYDTLLVKGILLTKTIESTKNKDSVHDEYVFRIRILEMKNKNLEQIDTRYRIGKIIVLSLYDYGRVIEK
jgi:hypothetical protein